MGFFLVPEALEASLSKVSTFADEFINSFWNVFDNDYMSLSKNLQRFDKDDFPLGSDLAIFVPLSLALAAINFGIGIWYSYLYRDAWDAYWQREEKRLKKIAAALNPPENNLDIENFQGESTCLLNSLSHQKKLSSRKKALLEKIALVLKSYQADTLLFKEEIDRSRDAIPRDIEAPAEFTPLELTLNPLVDLLEGCENWSEIGSVWNNTSVHAANIEPTALPVSHATIPSPDTSSSSDSEKKSGNKVLDFIENFSASSGFATAFAYAWGYWFVFYFAVWGLGELSPYNNMVLPLDIALVGLICPVIYLLYKEYVAYKQSLLVDESTLSKEEKEELEAYVTTQESALNLNKKNTSNADIQVQTIRKNKLREILNARAENNRGFRWGWVIIAVIAGVSVFCCCGLPLIPAILAGISVLVSIGLIVRGVTEFLDKQAAIKRDRLLNVRGEEPLAVDTPLLDSNKLEKGKKRRELMSMSKPHLNKTLDITESRIEDKTERKKWANARKAHLKEIEYLIRCLEQEEKLAVLAARYNVDLNTAQKTISDVSIPPQKEKVPQKSLFKKAKYSLADFWQRNHRWIATILDFLTSYMLGCLLGFAFGEVLNQVINHVLLLAGTGGIDVAATLTWSIVVGVFSLLVASSSGYRTWKAQGELNKAMEAQKDEEVFKQKELNVETLRKQTHSLRENLRMRLKNEKLGMLFETKEIEDLKVLIEKPVKKWEFSLRKFVRKLRQVVYAFTSISSVLLIARALTTMGFLAYTFGNGSLIMFGAAAAATNPLGITILTLACLILLFRLGRELYLSGQQVNAARKIEGIDLKLEKKKNEHEHLLRVEKLLDKNIQPEQNFDEGNEKPKPGDGQEPNSASTPDCQRGVLSEVSLELPLVEKTKVSKGGEGDNLMNSAVKA